MKILWPQHFTEIKKTIVTVIEVGPHICTIIITGDTDFSRDLAGDIVMDFRSNLAAGDISHISLDMATTSGFTPTRTLA